MRNTLTIARREFLGYFNGPIAYIVICIVLVALGFFFWQPFFLNGRATVRDMFELLTAFMVFAAPAMSMGLLAEEKRTGTIELLVTMPVRDAEVVLGKYLAVMGLFAVLLVLTLPYPISVAQLGNLDWGPVAAAYLGILLNGGAMLAIGLMTSSFTSNQLVAFFVAVALCALFRFVDMFIPLLPGSLATPLQWISLGYHFRSMARGVIDSRDVIYFLTIMSIALAVAFRSLESRRWR